jgi:hypothetical protein
MSKNKRTHNLNIYTYSLNDLLELFNLSYNISIEDLKNAKKIEAKCPKYDNVIITQLSVL